jgi:hypothetical protein
MEGRVLNADTWTITTGASSTKTVLRCVETGGVRKHLSVEPRKIIIGFGTGRCGTKSLAEFLNKQPGLNVTHEGVALGWYPAVADIDTHINHFFKRNGDIIGDVGFYWVNYLDLILHRHSDVKVINLIRDDEEVVNSFWNYMQYGNESIGWYGFPFDSVEKTIDSIRIMVKRYRFLEAELRKIYPFSIYQLNTYSLNDKREMARLLDWLGAENDGRIMEIIHSNKNNERLQAFQDLRNGLKKGRLFNIRRSQGG